MSKLVLDPAAQIVLHPAMSQSLKVLGTTLGRDKLYRGLQYFSRLASYVLIMRGHKLEAARWDALKTNLASARKVLRLGKFMEYLQAALRLAQTAAPGDTSALVQIARQLAYTGFLFFDSVSWASSIRFVSLTPARAAQAAKLSMRFWLAGISLSIVYSLQRMLSFTSEMQKLRSPSSSEKDLASDAERKLRMQTLRAESTAVRYQLFQDALDVWLPASNLGLVGISDGVAGLFGTITSGLGLYLHWLKVNGAAK